ncbi:MAG: IS21 family transposase [Lacunisphaera sp.]|nr:IS21 family transposase [Lacunisphaera sp.]
MITQAQYDTLMKEHQKLGVVRHAALKANMHRETATRYLRRRVGPTEQQQQRAPRTYRTRPDALAKVWPEVLRYLEEAPELAREATALLTHLITTKPELTAGVSLRTLQERLQGWRAKHGPPREVFFPQVREPAESVQFDWFNANELGVTIAGQAFSHLLGHTVFPYSNWEWVLPCQSESSLSLRSGLQAALWVIGGVPGKLQMDHSSTATHTLRRDSGEREFNADYLAFCRHLHLEPCSINVARPNENGDVEGAHGHLKRRLKNHLLLRGSRDFADEAAYVRFLAAVCTAANALRAAKVATERGQLRPLPAQRYPESECRAVRVSSFSTVRVRNCSYSVPARLIGFTVHAHVSEREVVICHEREEVARFPRALGQQARIDFRHIITWLARKPGAFRRYVHREELFPSLLYRQAYDRLRALQEHTADARYLQLLLLAAETESAKLAGALGELLRTAEPPLANTLRQRLQSAQPPTSVAPFIPDLAAYDQLIPALEVSA